MHLGFVGNQFTWSRHFEDGLSIWDRHDRGLATNSWFQKFLGSRVHHLHYDSLDHSPLFIILSGLEPPPQKKNFRFEEMWLLDGRWGEIVEASWCSSNFAEEDDMILKKVERCGKDLIWWKSKYLWERQIGIRKEEEIIDSSQVESNVWWKQLMGKGA